MGRPKVVGCKDMTPEEKREYMNGKNRTRWARLQIQKRFAAEGLKLKPCRTCMEAKPITDEYFSPSKNSADGFGTVCYSCRKSPKTSKFMSPEQKKAVNDASYSNEHGYTRAERDALLKAPGACCAICGSTRALHVDHCHNALKIRGVCCNECNSGMGKFDDNPDLLEAAAAYLRQTGLHRSGERRKKHDSKRKIAWARVRRSQKKPTVKIQAESVLPTPAVRDLSKSNLPRVRASVEPKVSRVKPVSPNWPRL